MKVATNVPALNTSLSMRRADRGMQAAMRRLSSGFRINSAREDAAGLSIANKLTYQVGGLNRASENATHGMSLIQTAEGAMHEIHNMLQRMRELAVQAAHGTYSNSNKATIQLEIDQLIEEIHGISRRTEFNRMRVLNGEADRIIENRCVTTGLLNTGVIGLTRSVVTPTYVSSNVVPGRIEYDILKVGRHAIMPLAPRNGTGPLPGIISVNGISMNVRTNMTWGEFDVEFSRILEYAGIERLPSNTTLQRFYLVSVIAGSDQHITLDGTATLLNQLIGAGNPRSDRGSDAVIELTAMYDINNNPIQGLDAWSMSARGNQVTIRGNMGEEIRKNIQVQFSATSPTNHVFGDFHNAPTDRSFLVLGATEFEPSVPAGSGNFNIEPVLIPNTGTHTRVVGSPDPGTFEPAEPANSGDYNIVEVAAGTGTHSFVNPVFEPDPRQIRMDVRNFGPLMLQIGPGHNMAMSVQIPRINAETLGLVEFVSGHRRILVNYRNMEGASSAINTADMAIQHVSSVRSRLGAFQNRLESTVRNLDTTAENTEISRSRIQDTDIARESTRFATYNVMMQAAQAILAQANQRPQMLVSLLQ